MEPGHHRHRLLRLTGLDAQENQARRMLNDIARYREATERKEKRPLSESVAASRWRDEIFEPTVAAVPENLWAALPAAEVFHQVLEHRWFLSEQAGKDVGIDEAVASYVKPSCRCCGPSASSSRRARGGIARRGGVGSAMSVYRTPDSRFDSLPGFDFEPHYLDQDGLRMHYLDEGEATRCCSCTASRRGRSSTAR